MSAIGHTSSSMVWAHLVDQSDMTLNSVDTLANINEEFSQIGLCSTIQENNFISISEADQLENQYTTV